MPATAMVLCLKPLTFGLFIYSEMHTFTLTSSSFFLFLARLSLDQTLSQSDVQLKCRQDLLPSRHP